MDSKSIFNATICIVGIALLLIHTVNILLKKDRRKDENNLLLFIVFTAFHFLTYLTFTVVKMYYTSNEFITSFYTIFYIFNNVELLLLFIYTLSYISSKKKIIDIVFIINVVIFFIFIILDVVNAFTHIFFTAEKGVYQRGQYMIISQGYQFVGFAMVFILTAFNRKLNAREKIAFALYCTFPLIAIVLQNLLPGYAIGYLSIIISIELLFLFVNVKKNIQLAHEAQKNKEAEIKVMMSQIQPHFIYNTLASISTLIPIDQKKAQEALDTFTEYLRGNLSSLTYTGLITFSNELKHIKTYLSLEKMRFDDRLEVKYDIQARDFMVPSLSIQPLVENAVKHGIMQKIEGGVITIKTYENANAFVVEVSDNGVGFDPNNLKANDPNHIGLNNVKYRISSMTRGTMKINSKKDKGTTVVVTFYK